MASIQIDPIGYLTQLSGFPPGVTQRDVTAPSVSLLDNAVDLHHHGAMTPEPTAELDARGLLCPLPVLKTRKRLAGLAKGEVLRVLADDPAAAIDMPHFCAEAGHALIGTGQESGAQVYFVRKGG